MDSDEQLKALQRLLPQLPAECGGAPGLIDTSVWNDWVGQSTTPDQMCMEHTSPGSPRLMYKLHFLLNRLSDKLGR